MAIDPANLGKTLAEIRKRRGLTQREVAYQSGLTVNFLSLLENGERGLTTETLNSYAKAVGVPTEFITFLAGDGKDVQDPTLASLSKSLKKAILTTISAES
ncbi:MAG: helix-turn-helix protein [Schlesneria sp.]|nr:helix-turn-helix protein [Schlesneria sp.]